TARRDFSSALLADGRALVMSGKDASAATALAEIYDPAAATWSATGPLARARAYAPAVTLRDRRVIVMGGDQTTYVDSSATVEIYDPVAGTFASGPPLAIARYDGVAVMLADGRVLYAGGGDTSGTKLFEAEIYDPSANGWTV